MSKILGKVKISSFILMLSALVFSLSVVLAWVNYSERLDFEHYYNIGNFSVNLEDKKSGVIEPVIQYASVELDGIFPSTDADGITGFDGRSYLNNTYNFRVQNKGNVEAMIRISVGFNPVIETADGKTVTTVYSDPGATDLSRYLKYAIKYSTSAAALPNKQYDPVYYYLTGDKTIPSEDEFGEPVNINNLTLQGYFDNLLVSGGKSTDLGKLASQEELFFEMRVWLAWEAELNETANKTSKIVFTMEALQSMGGAEWTDRAATWIVK